jgi:hypothetical protein
VFFRLGFSNREIVAICGAHTLGRAFGDRSGACPHVSGPQGSTSYTRPTCDAKSTSNRDNADSVASGSGGANSEISDDGDVQEFDAHWFSKESVDAVTGGNNKLPKDHQPVFQETKPSEGAEKKENGRGRLNSIGLSEAFVPQSSSVYASTNNTNTRNRNGNARDNNNGNKKDTIGEGVGMAGGMSWTTNWLRFDNSYYLAGGTATYDEIAHKSEKDRALNDRIAFETKQNRNPHSKAMEAHRR